jgi:predicted lysophospholipase L1 biosynthesis ABC-type transport system permease subunit
VRERGDARVRPDGHARLGDHGRSALGASRGRIITQLFIEALVLAGVAALLGLSSRRSR